MMWDMRLKSPFDAFDEFSPDILVTQTYNVTPALVKVLKERPWIKVTMKGSDWGEAQKDMDLVKYPVLVANQNEIRTILELRDAIGKPDFIDIHYPQKYADITHSFWAKEGIKVVGLMSAADITDYSNGTYCDELACDIGYVGGYWPYKSHTLNQYLIPLCQHANNYRIKIFGNQPWGVPQYCGFINTNRVKDLFVSSTICPNISEPHSQVYGNDIIERPFKLLSSKAFVISDYVEGMVDVFKDGLVMCKTPEEFKQKVDYFLKNPDKRVDYINRGYDIVINNHTYFHRAAQFFNELNMPFKARECLEIYNTKIKEAFKL